jgi:ABC-type uncharacterized transport system permease subunit
MSSPQTELDTKLARLNTQNTQIQDKSNVALTRNRMLEIVQERNIFARKLYYTLIALIIFIIVFALVIYTMKR